jgi:succinate dehydrogenase flavin-adding protein (antitoxin of CptAB toxin-antitoxin module)
MEVKEHGKVRSPTRKERIRYRERRGPEGKDGGIGKGGLHV